MPYAQYNLESGEICATNSIRVDDEALKSLGRGQIEVEEGVTGGTHYINVESKAVEILPSEEAPYEQE